LQLVLFAFGTNYLIVAMVSVDSVSSE